MYTNKIEQPKTNMKNTESYKIKHDNKMKYTCKYS